MKLFPSSQGAVPSPGQPKAAALANVSHWLNVYDPIDLFGFRAEPMFEGCKDLTFSSATGLIDAHTAYFKRPHASSRKGPPFLAFSASRRMRSGVPASPG